MRRPSMGKVYQRRGSSWWIEYRYHGRQYRESVAGALGVTPRAVTRGQAEALLRSRIEEVLTDRLIEPAARRLTVGHLLDALETDYTVREIKSLDWMQRQVGYIRADVGHLPAQVLTATELGKLAQRWRARGLAASTTRDRLATLGQALRLAVVQRRLREAPVLPRIEVRNARQGFIEPAEFERIAAGCPHVYGEVVRWAWLTAWRQGEILGLRWDQVSRARDEVRLATTKNGDVRTLPVGGLVKALLDARWRDRALGCAFVFHRKGKALHATLVRRLFRAAAVKAGFAGLIFHDLRRSAVRNMERAGVLRTVAMRISGHRSESMYRRYAIVSTEDVSQALARTEAYVAAASEDHSRTIRRKRPAK